MKIAVASQNRREVTGHTGRCRKCWSYESDRARVRGRALLELSRDQAFHDSPPHLAHPLDGVDALISGGMGSGLIRRLAARGVKGLVTFRTRSGCGGRQVLGRLPAGGGCRDARRRAGSCVQLSLNGRMPRCTR